MDLTIRTTEYGVDTKRWVGSQHGYPAPAPSIALVSDMFTTAFPDGFVPSGVALGKVTATGRYGPYASAATDGRQTMVGFLADLVTIRAGAIVGAALYEHGPVVEAFLPTNHGLTAAGKTSVAGRIWFR